MDYTGISGVGVVAYGVVFPDGHVALRWASDHPATSLWNSIDDLLAIHGHGDATSVEWLDPSIDLLDQVPARLPGRRARRPATAPEADSASRPAASAPMPAPAAPPPPPPEPTYSVSASAAHVPPQRRPGRHRRMAPEQQSRSTQPIESDRR